MAVQPTKKLYAVVELGGAQELVVIGDKIETDRVDAKEGGELICDKVLLLADGEKIDVGTPYVAGGKVTFKVTQHKKDVKIKIIRFKAKSRYRRTTGHRQPISILEVIKIGDHAAASKTKVTIAKKAPAKKLIAKKGKAVKNKASDKRKSVVRKKPVKSVSTSKTRSLGTGI